MTGYTKTQFASLALVLGKMESDISDDMLAALRQSGDKRYIDLAGEVHDRGDESVADELIAVENALTERHVRELREIKAAQQRLAAGKIEQCADCGDEIGIARLLANPVALRCIECQERFDRTHAHENTPQM